jgi:hypothetical protein
MLRKCHKSSTLFSWGKRWFEVDDTLGVLLCFKTQLDQDRRTPHHVYPLSSFTSAEEEGTYDFTTHAFALIPSHDPSRYGFNPDRCRRLVLAAESKALQRRWVRGLQQRTHCPGVGATSIARTVVLDVSSPAKTQEPTLSRSPSHASQVASPDEESSDAEGDEGPGSAALRACRAARAAAPAPPRENLEPDAREAALPRDPGRRGVGVTVCNNPIDSIGSLIQRVDPDSPAEVRATATSLPHEPVNGAAPLACCTHPLLSPLLLDGPSLTAAPGCLLFSSSSPPGSFCRPHSTARVAT